MSSRSCLRVGLEVAGVAGVVRVAVAAVLLADGSGFAQQRAVQEHLRRAQRQEVVAEAAGDAQVQAGRCGTVRRMLPVERMQHVQDRHQLGAGMQPAVGRRPLVGGQLHRAVADPAAADPGLGKAGDALRRRSSGWPGPARLRSSATEYGRISCWISCWAVSWTSPVGRPAPSRTITPPSGSGNDAGSAPASRSAAVLTTAMCPELCRMNSGRLPGDPVQHGDVREARRRAAAG